MKFSYNWLKELTGVKDSPQELAELLTMRVFEVEGVEKVGEDWALDIKILPNRIADASGHRGLADEIAAIKRQKLKDERQKLKESKELKTSQILQIKIENLEDCPRYSARLIEGIKIGSSPDWIKQRLSICGVQSINNVVDAANYVMLETGQPLHVFDFDKLQSKKEDQKTIIVRRAKAGEKMPALDDKTYALDPETLVIADERDAIAIAGVKGGAQSGVSEQTTAIVLESANFDPVRIRIGSQMLKLKTDASYRFEHGLDPNQTLTAVDRLAELIQQVAGGAILAGAVDSYPKKTKAAAILFRPEYANRLIGKKLPSAFYKEVFSRLGCDVQHRVLDTWIVRPPTQRFDLRIEEDLIEEAARIFDYKNVPAVMPLFRPAAAETNLGWHWVDRVRDLLIGAGFNESELYQFTGERELKQFGLSAEGLTELENPTSPETKYLVPRALIKYVSSVAENLRNFDSVSIFGIQKSFPVHRTPERKDLILAAAQKESSGDKQFYQLKGVIDQLLGSLGISELRYEAAKDHSLYHPHRAANIKVGNDKIGIIGEVHPDILSRIKSRARIVAAEIDMEKLARLATAESEFQPIGKFPAIMRDIAVLAPIGVKTEDILNLIENVGGELLIDTDLFDYFQDEAMRESDKKSLAFHLVFQSPERTLTDAEIEAIIKKISSALEEKEWEVRE